MIDWKIFAKKKKIVHLQRLSIHLLETNEKVLKNNHNKYTTFYKLTTNLYEKINTFLMCFVHLSNDRRLVVRMGAKSRDRSQPIEQ